MKWISVKDKLPKSGKQTEVVFYKDAFSWKTGMYTPKGFLENNEGVFEYHKYWGDDEYHKVDGVTHWIPLPDPPKPY